MAASSQAQPLPATLVLNSAGQFHTPIPVDPNSARASTARYRCPYGISCNNGSFASKATAIKHYSHCPYVLALIQRQDTRLDWLDKLIAKSDLPIKLDDRVLNNFRSRKITEDEFLLLSDSDLADLEVPLGPRLLLLRLIASLKGETKESSSQQQQQLDTPLAWLDKLIAKSGYNIELSPEVRKNFITEGVNEEIFMLLSDSDLKVDLKVPEDPRKLLLKIIASHKQKNASPSQQQQQERDAPLAWLDKLIKDSGLHIKLDDQVRNNMFFRGIDEETFILLSDGDLVDLGVPLEPRLGLLKLIALRRTQLDKERFG